MPRARANGIDIEYETFGRPGDPAVLLIMGFASQLTLWPVSLCEGLAAKGFYVIRFDNRDAGRSTHLSHLGAPDPYLAMAKATSGQASEIPYSLDDMAADAAGLLAMLGIESAHIVGASMGGMIAQIFAAKYPRKTRGLVSIMSSTGRRDLPPPRPDVIAALAAPPASDSRADRIAAGRRIWNAISSPGFRPTEKEITELVGREVDRAPYDPAAAARQMTALLTAEPRNAILREVRAPALVIHGADDPLVSAEGGRDTANSIPGCEFIVIPGMGHDLSNALAPLVLGYLADFVERAERRGAD